MSAGCWCVIAARATLNNWTTLPPGASPILPPSDLHAQQGHRPIVGSTREPRLQPACHPDLAAVIINLGGETRSTLALEQGPGGQTWRDVQRNDKPSLTIGAAWTDHDNPALGDVPRLPPRLDGPRL